MFFVFQQGPIGLDGPKGEPVSILFSSTWLPSTKLQAKAKRDNVPVLYSYYFQGRQGDKGQKGDGGVSSGIDVFSTVKVMEESRSYFIADPTFHFHSFSELIKIPIEKNKNSTMFFSIFSCASPL